MKTADKTRFIVVILGSVVLVGLGLLISRQIFNYGGLAFEILTYVLSIVALLLAVVSVANGIRQGRVMNRIVKDVHEELKQTAQLNSKIEQDIREDHEMSETITKILEKYGITADDKLRRSIKRKTHRRIKKHGL